MLNFSQNKYGLTSRKIGIRRQSFSYFCFAWRLIYQCTPHGNMGTLGLIVVGNNFNNIDKIEEVELSHVAKSVLQRLIRIAKSNN